MCDKTTKRDPAPIAAGLVTLESAVGSPKGAQPGKHKPPKGKAVHQDANQDDESTAHAQTPKRPSVNQLREAQQRNKIEQGMAGSFPLVVPIPEVGEDITEAGPGSSSRLSQTSTKAAGTEPTADKLEATTRSGTMVTTHLSATAPLPTLNARCAPVARAVPSCSKLDAPATPTPSAHAMVHTTHFSSKVLFVRCVAIFETLPVSPTLRCARVHLHVTLMSLPSSSVSLAAITSATPAADTTRRVERFKLIRMAKATATLRMVR